jgi:hypothetical protein
VDLLDGQLPRIGGESTPVHKNQIGQCHGGPPSAPCALDRIVKPATRRRASFRHPNRLLAPLAVDRTPGRITRPSSTRTVTSTMRVALCDKGARQPECPIQETVKVIRENMRVGNARCARARYTTAITEPDGQDRRTHTTAASNPGSHAIRHRDVSSGCVWAQSC